MNVDIRCSFHHRTPSAKHPEKFDYRLIAIANTFDQGPFRTACPPTIGAIVHLTEYDDTKKKPACYRVVALDMAYPDYGSVVWPQGTVHPTVAAWLNIVVVTAEPLFADEAKDDEE